MPQHDIEAAPIGIDHRVEATFYGAIKPAVLTVMFADQKSRTQHRRQRQRNDDRNHNGCGDGDGEFVEQPSDNAAHQQQWNENCDQRNADRKHGKADLPRALDRRLQRRGAGLQVPEDVLDDDDGIVDHESDRDGQRHQRQIVEAKAGQIDDCCGAKQRQWHGGARDEGGMQAAQEQQDDEHDQGAGQQQGKFDVLD